MTNTEGFELEVWVQFGLDNELCNIFKVHHLKTLSAASDVPDSSAPCHYCTANLAHSSEE